MAIANFFISNSRYPCEMTQENDGRPSTHFATLDFSIWFPPLTWAFFLSPWVLQQPYQSLCGSNANENCLLLHLGLASQHQSWLRALIIVYSILFAALGVGILSIASHYRQWLRCLMNIVYLGRHISELKSWKLWREEPGRSYVGSLRG